MLTLRSHFAKRPNCAMPKHSNLTIPSIPTVLQNCVSVSLFFAVVGTGHSAIAKSVPQPSSQPLDIGLMQQGLCAQDEPGISDTSVLQTELTEPSLWWIRDQIRSQEKFGSKLIDRWLACQPVAGANRVDVMVNSQLWSLLDFFDRYEFVNRFGTVTTGYGYNLRVFNGQGGLVAAYTCNFSPDVAAREGAGVKQDYANATSLDCEVFDASAKTNFWSPTRRLDGLSPTTGGTGQP